MVSDVRLIKREGRKLVIYNECEKIEYYERIENILPVLDDYFYGCLKGCYINLSHVIKMDNYAVFFDSGQKLYLGRDNYIKTKQKYCIYLKKLVNKQENACNSNEYTI